MDKRILNTIKELENNGFKVEYFENTAAVKEALLKKIDIKENVGIGGSKTIFDMSLHEDLIKRGNKVYWHWLVPNEQKDEQRKLASETPVYISSTNGITEDGKLVNIDGLGNRVSSMYYGHERQFVVAGINKISKNIDESIKRIKKEACPPNAERLNLNTPCRYTKECSDCKTPDRMCNITVILDHAPMKSNITIFLVNEKLGF